VVLRALHAAYNLKAADSDDPPRPALLTVVLGEVLAAKWF
jgi:hypothetical protein